MIGGALGIGFHSYHLLIEALSGTVSTLPPGYLHDILWQISSVGYHVPSVGHAHTHIDVLDPNAAWFAAISVLSKEWLYRVTKKVADEEHSPVLYANAVHHRSDAYSSFVALFAILGSSIFPTIPLDPLGGTLTIRHDNHATTNWFDCTVGLLVSFVILQQGVTLFRGAFAELMDAGISTRGQEKLMRALYPVLAHPATRDDVAGGPRVLAIRELRAKRAGSLIYVDLTVDVPNTMTVLATTELESKMNRLLKDARKEVSEVRVKFHPVEDSQP